MLLIEKHIEKYKYTLKIFHHYFHSFPNESHISINMSKGKGKFPWLQVFLLQAMGLSFSNNPQAFRYTRTHGKWKKKNKRKKIKYINLYKPFSARKRCQEEFPRNKQNHLALNIEAITFPLQRSFYCNRLSTWKSLIYSKINKPWTSINKNGCHAFPKQTYYQDFIF